jgi:hypothetical protein
MGIEDLIQARPGEDSLGSSRLDHPIQYWGPPLSPAETRGSDDRLGEGKDPESAPSDEDPEKATKKNYFAAIATKLQPRELLIAATKLQPHQLLIGATVLVATFGIAALAYIGSSAGEKVAAASQQSSPAVQSAQSAPEGSRQRASPISVSAADPSVAVAWPDLPASVTAEPAEVGSAAPNAKTALNETATPKEDVVFLQRPGVHIRSAPSTNGRVLATVPKGARFKVTNREGDWVQVENDRFSGWIRSRFLAANEP